MGFCSICLIVYVTCLTIVVGVIDIKNAIFHKADPIKIECVETNSTIIKRSSNYQDVRS